jgi:hypothetical protein
MPRNEHDGGNGEFASIGGCGQQWAGVCRIDIELDGHAQWRERDVYELRVERAEQF